MTEIQATTRQDEPNNEHELLSKLVKGGVIELRPVLSSDGIHYPEMEEILKSGPKHAKNQLQELVKRGILEARFIDRVLTCPNCSSPEVYNKFTCSKCNSYNVEYIQLLEHMKCGYIGSRGTFRKNSDLICPNCKTPLGEEATHYRVIGKCFQCEKCNYRFDKPDNTYVCQKCGRNFTYQDAKYVKIHVYKITDKTIADISKDQSILESAKEIFENNGFKVQLNAQIMGVSGVQHHFDMLAESGQVSIVIDISVTGSKNDMISLLGKKVDINPTEAVIIDLSKSDELPPLGKVYNITVFKMANKYDLPKHLKLFLTNLRSTETSLSLAYTALTQAKPPAREFYAPEKPVSKPIETIGIKTKLEKALELLDRKEQILHENLKILEEKFTIRMREEVVKAKRKALERLSSQVKATT